jgi:formylglycine-generating enzyme required for sulfatase activity
VKAPAGSFLSSGKPGREVQILDPFCIGRFEVTQGQWKKVMGDNPSGHKGDALPVEGVLWEEIEEFLKRLNARSPGARYRLPTNAQWEYAARAGTAGAVSFDGNPEGLSRYGNCQGKTTMQVGSLAPNPWGTFDMYGNVAELVQDDPLPATATPGMNALASVLPEKHVRRGGSFRNKPENCDSLNQPAVKSRRNKDTGFRILRDPN